MLEKLVWESDFFNKQIYNINFKKFSDKELIKINNLNFSLITAKIDNRNLKKIEILKKFGFKMISKSSVYEKKNIGSKNANYQIANLKNYNELKFISKNIFTYSRIKDSYFGKDSQNKFYAHWIKKSINGKFDDCCIVTLNDRKKINGFVTLKIINDTLKIGLFGIPKQIQSRGYGIKLLQTVNHYKSINKIKKSIVTTQSDNLSAINVFLKDDYLFKEDFIFLYLKKNNKFLKKIY